MTPKGYVIAQIAEIHDHDSYARYRELTQQTVAEHEGRFIVRGGAAERVEGVGDCGRVVVIEFPSIATAKAWYGSAEYQAALALRLAASTGTVMLVEGA